MSGLELLRALQQQGDQVTTVILTAQGTVETAVEAIKEGAYDYLTKPVDLQRLRILLDKIVERQATLREVQVLRRQLREQGAFGPMIGNSPEMRKIYHVVEQAAPTSASVLISGESGTGKELVAQTIHRLSPRAAAPYVPINCAAIPETLLESELFGHEKGAFTGASERRQGCFELADRGTLFLDEIAEMTPATQVKLLRVLQERTFRPPRRPGRAVRRHPRDCGHQRRSARSRAAGQAAGGSVLPPQRVRDPPAAAAGQEGRSAAAHSGLHQRVQRQERTVGRGRGRARHADARELLLARQRARAAQCDRARDDCRRGTVHRSQGSAGARRRRARRQPGAGLTPGTTVEEAERQLILLTLEHTNDNKTRAAEMLGISLKTLHNKLNRLKLREQGDRT